MPAPFPLYVNPEENSIDFSFSFLSFKLCQLALHYNLLLRSANENKIQSLKVALLKLKKKVTVVICFIKIGILKIFRTLN